MYWTQHLERWKSPVNMIQWSAFSNAAADEAFIWPQGKSNQCAYLPLVCMNCQRKHGRDSTEVSEGRTKTNRRPVSLLGIHSLPWSWRPDKVEQIHRPALSHRLIAEYAAYKITDEMP